MNGPAPPSIRRHDIDRLRVGAVLVVFVIHLAQIFSPLGPWHIQNAQPSRWLGQLTALAAPWIMPLFMMLAGWSSAISLERKGGARHLAARIGRICVPLVVGTLLVIPPQMWYLRRFRGEFEGSLASFWPHFFDGIYPAGNFSWGHLWFLAYLLAYSVVTLPLLLLLARPGVRARMARGFGRLAGPGWILLLSLPFSAALASLWWRYPLTGALVNDWAIHAWLLPAFLLGALLRLHPRLTDWVRLQWRSARWVAAAASLFIFAFAWPGDAMARLPADPGGWYFLFWGVFGVATAGWLVVLSGWGEECLDRPSPWLQRWGGSAYAFYIFHQTVLVAVAFYVVPLSLPVPVKFGVIGVLGIGGTLGLVAVARRLGPLGRALGAGSG